MVIFRYRERQWNSYDYWKEPRENVREYAYRVLYDNIMNLHLVPGTAMSEQELSTMLSVSRTPVREAFIRLSQKRPSRRIAPAGDLRV